MNQDAWQWHSIQLRPIDHDKTLMHTPVTNTLYGVEIYLFFLLFLSRIESSLLCLLRPIISSRMHESTTSYWEILQRGNAYLLVLAPGLLCESLGQRRVISDDEVVKQSAWFNLYIEKTIGLTNCDVFLNKRKEDPTIQHQPATAQCQCTSGCQMHRCMDHPWNL